MKQREAWFEEGQAAMVEQLLERRFGSLDEELKSFIPLIMQLSQSERTLLVFELSNLSRKQLLEKLKGESN